METIRRLSALFIVLLFAQACSNVERTPEVAEVHDPHRTVTPTTLQAELDVPGKDITAAKLQFRDVPLELTLHEVAKDVWQAELTQDELALLSPGPNRDSQIYSATILIRAQDDKGRPQNIKKPVIVEYPQLTVG